MERKEYMANWAHGFDGFIYWDYRNEDIRIFGNTALAHSQNKYILVINGKEINGMSTYTDTYIKEKGQWKCEPAWLHKYTRPGRPFHNPALRLVEQMLWIRLFSHIGSLDNECILFIHAGSKSDAEINNE